MLRFQIVCIFLLMCIFSSNGIAQSNVVEGIEQAFEFSDKNPSAELLNVINRADGTHLAIYQGRRGKKKFTIGKNNLIVRHFDANLKEISIKKQELPKGAFIDDVFVFSEDEILILLVQRNSSTRLVSFFATPFNTNTMQLEFDMVNVVMEGKYQADDAIWLRDWSPAEHLFDAKHGHLLIYLRLHKKSVKKIDKQIDNKLFAIYSMVDAQGQVVEQSSISSSNSDEKSIRYEHFILSATGDLLALTSVVHENYYRNYYIENLSNGRKTELPGEVPYLSSFSLKNNERGDVIMMGCITENYRSDKNSHFYFARIDPESAEVDQYNIVSVSSDLVANILDPVLKKSASKKNNISSDYHCILKDYDADHMVAFMSVQYTNNEKGVYSTFNPIVLFINTEDLTISWHDAINYNARVKTYITRGASCYVGNTGLINVVLGVTSIDEDKSGVKSYKNTTKSNFQSFIRFAYDNNGNIQKEIVNEPQSKKFPGFYAGYIFPDYREHETVYFAQNWRKIGTTLIKFIE